MRCMKCACTASAGMSMPDSNFVQSDDDSMPVSRFAHVPHDGLAGDVAVEPGSRLACSAVCQYIETAVSVVDLYQSENR